MPTAGEPSINDALASLLRQTRAAWRKASVITSENTDVLMAKGKKPDIIICEEDASPVVVESEIKPGPNAEREAYERLGQVVKQSRQSIKAAIAIKYPSNSKTISATALHDYLKATSKLEMALYLGESPESKTRWPARGWLTGGLEDLSLLIQSASVPPELVIRASECLENGILSAANCLDILVGRHPGVLTAIAAQLHQEDGAQTRRMAATILANAFTVHEGLAGGPGKLAFVKGLSQLNSDAAGLSHQAVLREWKNILEVNYWPIFDIASRILALVPASQATRLCATLSETALELVASRLTKSHDLIGSVFQRLIADRKFLAAYYTTPASAALMTGLCLDIGTNSEAIDWGKREEIQALRIADFSCGTGTLLSTVYSRICSLHEIHGGDSAKIHEAMMAHCLVGCDVLPAAVHLTASMLSGVNPTINYFRSRILNVPYGRQVDNSYALGSIDFLEDTRPLSIARNDAKSVESFGQKERESWLEIPSESFDLIVMNPPFTRATGHDASNIGIPNPMFAAFASSEEDQAKMAEALNKFKKANVAYHGNAGEASIFLSLGHKKLKKNGVMGLIMPLSLMCGDSWKNSRKIFTSYYSQINCVSIAGIADKEIAFSADTGMGECLILAKKSPSESTTVTATFTILNKRIDSTLEGRQIASAINKIIASKLVHRLEDGPFGGTPIYVGDDEIGQVITADITAKSEEEWYLSRIKDLALAQTAHQLSALGKVWLPTMPRAAKKSLVMTSMEKVVQVGPYSVDIDGWGPNKSIRGPFNVSPVASSKTSTFPLLWAHDAPREAFLSFEADCEAKPKVARNQQEAKIIADKVEKIWNSASYCHFNRDFRFNSQPTAMQITRARTIGGRAWISLKAANFSEEIALALWGNSSLGILAHWWQANKQQMGRGTIGVNPLRKMKTLDISTLSSLQLEQCRELFTVFEGIRLLPAHQIQIDTNRHRLDWEFLHKILGLDVELFAPEGPLQELRNKMANEPTIRGSKKVKASKYHMVGVLSEESSELQSLNSPDRKVRKKKSSTIAE